MKIFNSRAFTLTEVVIAVGLLGAVGLATGSYMSGSFKNSNKIADKVEVQTSVTALMNKLETSLKTADVPINFGENNYNINNVEFIHNDTDNNVIVEDDGREVGRYEFIESLIITPTTNNLGAEITIVGQDNLFELDGTYYSRKQVPTESEINNDEERLIILEYYDGTSKFNEQTSNKEKATFTITNKELRKDGYEFLGWSESLGATTAEYGWKSGLKTNIEINANKKLYAVWENKEYNVIFYNDIEVGRKTVTYLGKYGELPITSKTVEDYRAVFKGWYTEENQLVTEDTIVEKTYDHKLYARFDLIPLCECSNCQNDVTNKGDYCSECDGEKVCSVCGLCGNCTTLHSICGKCDNDDCCDCLTILVTPDGIGGTIEPSGLITVKYGSSKTFTAKPLAGYEVSAWTVDGAVYSLPQGETQTTYTLSNLKTNREISVTFREIYPCNCCGKTIYYVGFCSSCGGHAWDEATCTTPKTCSRCKKTEGNPLEHEAGAEATCTTDQTCIRCSYVYVAKLGHEAGTEATCTTAQTCIRCSYVYVTALDHNWKDATCTKPKTCDRCGKTTGKELGHNWKDATCTEPKTCTRCDETTGNALDHDWKDATCTKPKTCDRCGKTTGKALGHNWRDATCTEPKTCDRCGETTGKALDHDWEDATCIEPKICKECGIKDGSALTHSWEDATCTEAKTCSRCDIIEGDALGHDWRAATCTEPKTCNRCGITQGEALGHDESCYHVHSEIGGACYTYVTHTHDGEGGECWELKDGHTIRCPKCNDNYGETETGSGKCYKCGGDIDVIDTKYWAMTCTKTNEWKLDCTKSIDEPICGSVHSHDSSCYHRHAGSESAGGPCYEITMCYGTIYTPHGSHYGHKCKSCDFISYNGGWSLDEAEIGEECTSHCQGGHYKRSGYNYVYHLNCSQDTDELICGYE